MIAARVTSPTANRTVLPRTVAKAMPRDATSVVAPPLLETTLAVLFVGAFVVRASLLPHVAGERLTSFLAAAPAAVLLLSVVYMALDGAGRLNFWGALLLAATGASLWHCERFDFALPRWIGWLALVLILGPIRTTQRARLFRQQAFAALSHILLAATLLSAFWLLAGLPNLGRGDFTGVMAHSMILGPAAGFVGLMALTRAVNRGTLLDYLIYALCWTVCLPASSRAALAALIVGTLIIIALRFKKNPLIASLVLATALSVVIMPTAALSVGARVLPDRFTEGFERKSLENTRELLWQARWDEFRSSPLTGIGFVSAWEDTAGYDTDTGTVETGSSYLAILSMTGCLGAGAAVLLTVSLARRMIGAWPMLHDEQRLLYCALAGFYFVHLGAEGYIYAVSSMLAVTFWLWLGRLHDDLCNVEFRRRGLRSKLRRLPHARMALTNSRPTAA